MFDIGWSELLLIGGVALVVIGPKDLPRALRTLGQTTTKVRRMAADFQRQFNEAVREADMEEFRKGVSDVVDTARDLKNNFNPIDKLRSEIKGAIDDSDPRKPLPTTEVASAGDYLTSLPEPAPAQPVKGLAPASPSAAPTLEPPAEAKAEAPAPKKRVRKPRAKTPDVIGDAPATTTTTADTVATTQADAVSIANADAVTREETQAVAGEPARKPARSRKKVVAVLAADDAAITSADVAGAAVGPQAPKATRRRRKVAGDVADAPETAAAATSAKKRAPRKKPAPLAGALPADAHVAKAEAAAPSAIPPATASVDDAISPAIKPASDGTP